MKRILIFTVMVLFVALFVHAGGTPETSSDLGTLDEEIKQDIVNMLYWDDRVDSSQISVFVEDGQVRLEGSVPSFTQRRAAEEDARDITGVTSVENNISVTGAEIGNEQFFIRRNVNNALELASDIDAESINVEIQNETEVILSGTVDAHWKKVRAEEIARNTVGVTDVENDIAVVPTEDVVDERIAEDIEAALERSQAVDDEDVLVYVDNGVVRLEGSVGTWWESREAYKIASNTLGVIDVVNNIEIAERETALTDDRLIESNIKNQLQWDSRVDASEIVVSVEDGVVTLEGTVSTFSAMNAATDDVWNVPGVVDLENNLEIEQEVVDISDQSIEIIIEQSIEWNSEVNVENIQIQSASGFVTLSGTVDALWKKEEAEEIASEVSGVLDVENTVTVVPSGDESDKEIAESIMSTLENKAGIDVDNIDVIVNEGVVTLSGTVESWSEHNEVYNVALFTSGVVEIEDNLVVMSS